MAEQKWPHTLILMRHGQSERNVLKDAAKAAGREMVWSEAVRDQDTPLTRKGKLQCYAAGTHLRKLFPETCPDCPQATLMGKPLNGCGQSWHEWQKLDMIYVSPYLRALQTAEQVCKGLGYTPEIVREERIREIEFGILDGLTPEGIRVKYPEEVARRKKEGKYWYRPPGGENRPDVNLRIHSWLGTLTRSARKKNVLVCAHSVTVMCIRHLLERWGEEDYLQVDKEDDVLNASLTTYNCVNGKLTLEEYNQVTYELPGRPTA